MTHSSASAGGKPSRRTRSTGHPNLTMLAVHLKRSVSTLEGYIRVGKGLAKRRLVDAAFAAGRITYTHVVHLLPIVVEETEAEWVETAAGMSSRELEKLAAKRAKGDRPNAPDRRGSVHAKKLSHTLRLSVTQDQMVQRALEKACAEAGCRLTLRELFVELCQRHLRSQPDGTVSGWKPVHREHYRIHARELPDGDPDRLDVKGMEGEEVEISRAELAASPFLAAALLRGAGEPTTPLTVVLRWRELDPDNSGPELALEHRAPETSLALREKVHVRDGHTCVVCGKRETLSVHHIHWRRYGGRTVMANLVTLCEGCHSMVHERLLILLLDPVHGLRKLGPDGRPLGPAQEDALPFEVAPTLTTAGADASPEAPEVPETPEQPVTLATLPGSVDLEWLRRHVDLIAWNERQGVLELTPGFARRSAAEPAQVEVPQLRLGDLVGQSRLRERLAVAIEGERRLGRQLEHLLFTGAAGRGKTTLAEAVAGELGGGVVRLPAPLVKSPEVLLRKLMGLRAGEVVLLDEAHALLPRLAEVFYEGIDRNELSLPIREAGAGLEQRTLRVRLPAFTLIGATTDPAFVPAALRSRLRVEKLERYSAKELAEIVTRAATSNGVALEREAAALLVGASRESPRRALSLLREVCQEAAVAGTSAVDLALVERTLARRGIDGLGFDPVDRAILEVLERARGRAVSLRSLAAQVGESEAEIRSLREPALLAAGLIRTTPHGRVLPWGARVLPGRPESN